MCVKIFINNLQSSANSTAFIARGGQIFPRPQYNFSNCNVQIHNHYGQSGWIIDSWHCDTFCPLKVVRFFEETVLSTFFERAILSARCQFFARQLDRAFMTGHVMFSLYVLWSGSKCVQWQFPVIGLLRNLLKQLFFSTCRIWADNNQLGLRPRWLYISARIRRVLEE